MNNGMSTIWKSSTEIKTRGEEEVGIFCCVVSITKKITAMARLKRDKDKEGNVWKYKQIQIDRNINICEIMYKIYSGLCSWSRHCPTGDSRLIIIIVLRWFIAVHLKPLSERKFNPSSCLFALFDWRLPLLKSPKNLFFKRERKRRRKKKDVFVRSDSLEK